MPQPFPSIIAENFNGGWVPASEPTLLQTNQLQQGNNIRYSKAGGFSNRPGILLKSLDGLVDTSKITGGFSTDTEIFFVCNGNLYVTLSDVSNAFIIATGINTSVITRFLQYNGNLYAFNGEDELKWIKISTIATALVSAVSTTVDVRIGQGWRFPSSGTVYVVNSSGADAITVTNKTNDTLTITAATVSNNASIGDKIYYVETIAESVAPKFAAGIEFKNVFLACIPKGKVGSNFQGNTLFYSRGGTGVNPEYFHDFVNSPAGYIPVGDLGDITNISKTKSYAVISKKNSTITCSGYDDTSGAPLLEPLTEAYGCAGPDSTAQVGDQLLSFTGKEIKQFGEQVGLNNLMPSVNARFDDKLYTYLNNLTDDQSDAVMSFNPSQKLLKLWHNLNGARVCLVYDDKNDAWALDTNKPVSVATVYKGETFWGSQFEAKIYQDEIGYDDNGEDIQSVVKTAEFNAGQPRLSKYFKTLYIQGKLGLNTTVTVRIYFDSVLVQSFQLVAANLISAVGGTPIGRNLIGNSFLGSNESATLAFPFQFEKQLKKRKNVGKMYIEFESEGQGQVFEINSVQIEGTYSKKFDKLIKS